MRRRYRYMLHAVKEGLLKLVITHIIPPYSFLFENYQIRRQVNVTEKLISNLTDKIISIFKQQKYPASNLNYNRVKVEEKSLEKCMSLNHISNSLTTSTPTTMLSNYNFYRKYNSAK